MKPVTPLPTDQQTVVLLPRSSSVAKTYLPIPVDHLEEEYRLRSADDGKLFREEFSVRRLGFNLTALMNEHVHSVLKKILLAANILVFVFKLGKVLQVSSCVTLSMTQASIRNSLLAICEYKWGSESNQIQWLTSACVFMQTEEVKSLSVLIFHLMSDSRFTPVLSRWAWLRFQHGCFLIL